MKHQSFVRSERENKYLFGSRNGYGDGVRELFSIDWASS